MIAHNFLIFLSISLSAICLFAGCAMFSSERTDYSSELNFDSQQRLAYIKYIKENQENKNKIYSLHYGNCEYLVDSDTGVTLIQNLINPELVYPIINKVKIDGLSKNDKALICFEYIINYFTYFPKPETWPTVDQTIKMQKGDCKGFSLLFLSIFITFDIESYAAISNNHMWVEAKIDGHWKIFETDTDSDRNLIYQSPDFYLNPMFKIYFDRSEKRIRMKVEKS